MGETVKPTNQDVGLFLDRIGFHQDVEILETYPTFFNDRRVVRVTDNTDGVSRIWKFRPNGTQAQRELALLRVLWASYRFSGTHFPYLFIQEFPSFGYIGFKMEYLGVSLRDLAVELDLAEYGLPDFNPNFSGFTSRQIDCLIERLIRSHLSFGRGYGLWHGDLFQRGPNNIVYHPDLKKLFLVDAEALNDREGADDNFLDQAQRVREWMHDSLLKK